MPSDNNVIRVFSLENAVKVTGLTESRLAYWDNRGFFKPEFQRFGGGKAAIRIYSFRDLIALRVLNVLRNQYKIPLQVLRKVAAKLSEYSDTPFASLRLGVLGREVQVIEPDTGRARGVLTPQYVFLSVIDVIRDVERASAALYTRDASSIGKIDQKRNIAHNARVIAGTRIPVAAVKHFLQAGFSHAEIIKQYPALTKDDIDAVAAMTGALRAA